MIDWSGWMVSKDDSCMGWMIKAIDDNYTRQKLNIVTQYNGWTSIWMKIDGNYYWMENLNE